MRWRTSKSTPHCLAISHTCRASTSALRPRTPRGAHTVAGAVPEEAALQVHLALHVLALGAHLDGALQLALKLGAGGPRKGLLKTIMLSTGAGSPMVWTLRPRRLASAWAESSYPGSDYGVSL